jgi:hypothetical protein
MFVLCPHCQFLVALNPVSGHPPQRCPRCDGALQPAPSPADATATSAEPEPVAPPAPETVIAGDAAIDGPAAVPTSAPPAPPAPPEPPEPPAPAPSPKAKSKARSKAPRPETIPADPAANAPAAITAGQPDAGAAIDAQAPAQDAAPAVLADHGHPPINATVARPADATPGEEATPAASAAPPATAAPAPGTAPGIVVGEPLESPPAPSPPPRAAPRDKAMPSFVRAPAVAGRTDGRRKWREPAAIAALALLLALQLLLADRAQLAASARWRPLVSALCGALRCSVPAWREPAAFTLLHRDVRPHPTLPGVLHVSATFRNDARWPQPWPALLLTLSDVDGRNVGARAFAPRDYLGASPTRSGLASGQSATVAMDIVEPAPRIVAFTFDFR